MLKKFVAIDDGLGQLLVLVLIRQRLLALLFLLKRLVTIDRCH